MRFDDSLKTVLSAEVSTAFGARSAWRQLVDLVARGRAGDEALALSRLRALRPDVPPDVRAASARAVAFAMPGAGLVGLFAEDELAIAAPVLRTALLDADAWLGLLPKLTPPLRSVLRNRRDLPEAAMRGLASFGATDFVLGFDPPANDVVAVPPVSVPDKQDAVLSASGPAIGTPLSATPFVALGEVARGLPVVAEALRRSEAEPQAPRFEISDLVARIDAYRRSREEDAEPEPVLPPAGFRFETDSGGTIRWVGGAPRAALVGASIAGPAVGLVAVDGVASGAFRRRSRFADAPMEIGGESQAAGSWRIGGVPVFAPATGRFVGYRGTARRPRADESATPRNAAAPTDSLRQLVHELRTPTNAVAGFAELIESELLGPVEPVHRSRATTIRTLAGGLVDAIEDLDAAARIEAQALDLRPGELALAPVLRRASCDIAALAGIRGVAVEPEEWPEDILVFADGRAVERLLGRLLGAAVSAGGRGETVGIGMRDDGAGMAMVSIGRPVALSEPGGGSLFAIDPEREDEPGAPLLGTGFALRLAAKLAQELGGSLGFEPARLVLRLPLALARAGRASNS